MVGSDHFHCRVALSTEGAGMMTEGDTGGGRTRTPGDWDTGSGDYRPSLTIT